VYRIRTRVTEQGATIVAGDTGMYVDRRHKLTRAERLAFLDQDYTYTANQLDRDVVAESQIRTVLQQFHEKVLPDAFPDRTEVPKTLIFAKDDSHADDIVRLVREVFGQGNEFCQKITYRTGFTKRTRKVTNEDGTESEVTDWVKTSNLTPDEILSNFRNSFYPRIAVTVDMISTGTDVKPIECVFFMRNVKSAGFFEQMKGRGVRVMSVDKLRTVTPDAKGKDRFIVVDAVGVCEHDKTDSHSLNTKLSAKLEELLNYVAQGGIDPGALATLAGRLARMQRQFTPAQLVELTNLAGGKSFPDLARDLIDACDLDSQIQAAKKATGAEKPNEEQIEAAAEKLAQSAATPFMKAAFRRRILEIRLENEQTIDRHTIDDVLYSGFDAAAVEKAQAKVNDFRAWIATHRDELTALQAIYAGTRPLKISLKDLRQLRDALARPPLSASPEQLWRAFEAVEAAKVKGAKGEILLTDLVSLVRHALIPNLSLVPYRDELRERYQAWLKERDADHAFTPEQREWLDRMAEHIATSLSLAPDDFESGWFGQQGSLGRAHALFGEKLNPLMRELNERLAA
jgi:type I restriction enzyme R subunit